MRIAIIEFPGSNCERETMLAVERAGMEPKEFLWNESKDTLSAFQGFILVGGFSYEDRGRAGVIAALDPIMQALKNESDLGKPILGICNGAQILVESGLVPGLEHHKCGMALTDNKRMQADKVLGTGYYNAWINMRLADDYQLNAFTHELTLKHILKIPVAHAEGRFVIPPALLLEMQNNGQTVFQYCDDHGLIQNTFPVNPNGSIMNIAAVSNKNGNVMAMMPHPERTSAGDPIFQSMRYYIENGFTPKVAPLLYAPRHSPMTRYTPKYHEWITELLITDNQALTLENALHQRGIRAQIKRYTHWEIAGTAAQFEEIEASGVLYNNRKEKRISQPLLQNSNSMTILVRAKDDMLGLQKRQMLKDHFAIADIDYLQHGTLWQVTSPSQEGLQQVIDSHILFNPYSHDYYYV